MAYSRRKSIEENRNRRKAFVFFFLTIISIAFLFFYGLPAVIKYAAFFADIKKSSQPVELTDNTPPPPPFFEPLPAYTNNEKTEIKGRTEPGATIILSFNNIENELIANNEGNFNLILSLKKGVNKISAVAVDSSGNESKEVEIETVLDNEEPKIEITKPEDGSSFFGPKQRQLVIKGLTENNARLSINGRWIVVDSDGNFSYATTLEEGDNQFTVSAEDEAGNSKETSISVTYTP